MLSAVYSPSLPLVFSPSALLALSPSWLSVLPVLAFASPFRPLPSPAVCLALPSLLLAGALRLRPPVRRPQLRRSRRGLRRLRRWAGLAQVVTRRGLEGAAALAGSLEEQTKQARKE